MKVESVDIHEIHVDPANANQHPEEDIIGLMAKLATFTQVEPLVVQRKTNKVIGGNGRLEAMRRLGWTKCDVHFVDVDNVTATALGISLNRRKSMFDDTILSEQLRALQSEDFDLAAVGYDAGEIDAMIEGLGNDLLGYAGETAEDPGPQIDRAAELQEKWATATGQLWVIPSKATLGKEHRLLCGDCRNPEDIARVCPEKVNGAFTSPPYAEQRKEQYGGTPTDRYVEWWEAVQANVRGVLADDGSFFVNIKDHSEKITRTIYVHELVIAHVNRWGWAYLDEFCWERIGIPGDPVKMGKFKNQWEPVFWFALKTRPKFRPSNVTHDSDKVILDDNWEPTLGKHQGSGNGVLGSTREIGSG